MHKRSLFIFSSNKPLVFGLKIFLFCSIFLLYINQILPQYSQGYNASLIDKVNRLESIEGPKIVLVTNSNVTFGIDSQIIEDSFGMPVVNMGLHGGAGNAFHEEMAKFNVAEGDIYVLCHNDFADNDTIIDGMVAWTTVENNYKLWKILRGRDIPVMIETFPAYLKRCLELYMTQTGNLDIGGVYARSAFNEYGDVALERIGTEYNFISQVKPPKINTVTINRLNELNRYLDSRGATLLVAGYPIGNGILTDDADSFIEFQKELEQQLDCPVISNYVDYMFDYSYFYDTNYHLNTEGAKIRTYQLIADLQRWMEKEGKEQDAVMEEDIYTDIVSDVMLSHITNIQEYLDRLIAARDRYTIMVSTSDEETSALDDKILCKFYELGMERINQYGQKYVAVIASGQVQEATGTDMAGLEANVDENTDVCIRSGFHESGITCSVLVNGVEYSRDGVGLNIVVYSNESHRILDSVVFDANDNFLASREYETIVQE